MNLNESLTRREGLPKREVQGLCELLSSDPQSTVTLAAIFDQVRCVCHVKDPHPMHVSLLRRWSRSYRRA